MKNLIKILAIVVLALLLANIVRGGRIKMNKADCMMYEKVLQLNSLCTYKTIDGFIIKCQTSNGKSESIFFSDNRTLISNTPFVLKQYNDYGGCIGNKFSDIKQMFGSHYIHIGSGLFLPSYITDNGILISFVIQDGYITDFFTTDLLAN